MRVVIYEKNERYEVKINNSREKRVIDDDTMNLLKSLHGEDMSSIDGMMNMTLTWTP